MNSWISSPSRRRDKPIRAALTATRQVFILLVFLVTLVAPLGQTVRPASAAPVCTDVSLVVSEDTHMRSGTTRDDYNYGGSTLVRLNPFYEQGSNDGQLTGALFKWTMPADIPAGATVTAASLTFYVTDGAQTAYNLYAMRRAWVEGTKDGAAGSGASWTFAGAGVTNWGTAGAQNTSSDRYNTNLWDATGADFGRTGSASFALNAAGLGVIEDWMDGSLPNNGLTIQNYGGTAVDVWEAASSENTTVANRPKLNFTYCISSDPVITTAGAPLNAFSAFPGAPSAPQTYTVSGRNLTGPVTITAPANFELSTNGSTYSGSLSLAPASGTLAATTVYVRLNSAALGDYSGNITHASPGAAAVNVAVSGSVSLCTTASLAATEDTYLSSYNNQYNYGAVDPIKVTAGSSSGTRRSILMKWDLSSIPTNATVSSASVKFNVTTSANQTYSMYAMRQAWVEGTLTTGANSTTSANWNTYDGSHNWGTAGAASTSSDRFDANLWNATAATFNSTGSRTADLTAAGLDALEGWIATPSSNNGVTIQNYTSTSGSAEINASENTTAANQPTLTVSYCVPSGTAYTLTASNNGNGTVAISPPGGLYSSGTTVTLTPQPAEGYQFSGWTGTNASDIVESDGVFTLVMDGNKTVTANFSLIPVNTAPNPPTLVQPADGATGAATSLLLEVNASDADASDPNLVVRFYGRPAGGVPSGEDFTLVAIPDTQYLVDDNSPALNAQFDWIANHKTDRNIAFATALGDIVNASSTTQSQLADAAYDRLDAANVPYSVGPGNHDIQMGTSYYEDYFGVARFTGKPWYQGHYGSNNYNNYSFFSAAGNDFILINLQYNAGTSEINWADGLLKANPARRGIVVQHDILNTDNSFVNQTTFTGLKDNPNLFLMLCGHMHSGSDGAAYRAETGDDGHRIHIMMADYQDFRTDGNSGYLRLLRFSPAVDTIFATTYSPHANKSITTNPDQMDMAYDLTNGSGAPFELIGTVDQAANGANVSVTWGGLDPNTEYEWYAVADDGKATTNGPTWSFTTASAANHPPVITENDPAAISVSEDSPAYALTLHASDADTGDTLTWSISTAAANGTASAAGTGTTKVVNYTPAANYSGPDSFVVQVADGKGGTDTLTVNVTVTPLNDAPVITEGDSISIDVPEDRLNFEVPLNATDADLSDNLFWSISSPPMQGTASTFSTGNAGLVLYNPTSNYTGPDSFRVQVADGAGGTDTILVNVNVQGINDEPVATAQSVSVTKDTPKAITLTGSDVENSPLTFEVVAGPEHGDLSGTLPDLTYTPDSGYLGPDSFTFKARDGELESAPATVSIVVEENTVPLRPSSFYGEIHIAATDNPPAVGGLVEAFKPGDTGAVANDAIESNAGNLTYALNVPGGTKGSASEGDPVTFKIGTRVMGVGTWHTDTNVQLNLHPPQALPGGPYTGGEGAAIAFNASANDWGSDATTYQWDWDNNGTFDATGQTPNRTWNTAGTYTAVLKVTDAQGGEGTATFQIVVSNAAPVLAAIGNKNTNEQVELTFVASATDLDPLAYTLVNAPAGATIDPVSGTFRWTPMETQGPGDYSFTVMVCDNRTPALCDEEAISVHVAEANTAPVLAAIGNRSVVELTELSFTASATDADLPANSLTYSLVNAPTGATIDPASGAFRWTPTASQGPDSFQLTIKVCDSASPALCDEETITISVTESNAAPVLGSIGNRNVNELSELTFTAAAVDQDPLTYSLVGAPAGTTIDPTSGVFHWTPTEVQGPGSYPFTVKVCDNRSPALCDEEAITVTVAEVNIAPVLAVIGNRSVARQVELSFQASATDADLPANTLTYSLVNAPTGATIEPASGNFRWTPGASLAAGDYLFTVKVCDGGSPALCDEEAITVTVTDNVQTHHLNLAAGWNLISLDLAPVNPSPAAVLASLEGNYDLVYAWDSSGAHVDSGNWQIFVPATGGFQNTLTRLDEKMGFWIHMLQADTLDFTGTAPSRTEIQLSNLAGGWNLVGYPTAVNATLPAVLQDHGVGTDFGLVYAYHASDTADPWKLYDPTALSWANDLTSLSPGWGYWIYVTVSHNLTWTIGE